MANPKSQRKREPVKEYLAEDPPCALFLDRAPSSARPLHGVALAALAARAHE